MEGTEHNENYVSALNCFHENGGVRPTNAHLLNIIEYRDGWRSTEGEVALYRSQ